MGLKKMALLIFLLVFGSLSGNCEKKVIRGNLIRVHDGDTLTILSDGNQVRIRLENIDAPELSQPWGINSRENLRALVSTKGVLVVQYTGKDRYKRTLGEVFLADGTDVNKIQVLTGNAWAYKKYCKPLELWCEFENRARGEHRGLWSQQNPIPPWEYRHRRKR